MRKEIAKNVVLNIIPMQKFRTIKVQIDFLRPLLKDENAQRRLLANVLSNSTKKYPTFKKLNDREMELYGTEINVYTRGLINYNDLAISAEFADPQFLIGGDNLIKENLELLSEIILNLNIENNLFEKTAFDTEKSNLISNLLSIDDNQDLVSSLALNRLIYKNNVNKQLPIFGTVEQVENITNQGLLDYYKKVISEDTVVINVVGDVDEQEIINIFEDGKLAEFFQKERPTLDLKFDNFDELKETPAIQKEHKKLNQSRIAEAFTTEKISEDISFLAPQIMNLILGGDDQSQLFQEVREKNSLAYSVSSSYQPISRLVTIHAGLDANSLNKTVELISDQIDYIKNGNVSADQIEHAKKVMSTRRLIGSDSIQHYINRSIWDIIYPQSLLDDEKFRVELEKVDVAQVAEVASSMKVIAQYQLIGD
ncbi:EF-P 5-aminopentanol modification-associated protein YfmF [Companilactobacillus metriopterae]|uniref:EF-P 5-aminopentanol modification-associated protein YfmF n=1 Tax=Companilactobacillus metriopterae TaxID=1909267 RepID=UPI00100BC570|nr:pitrilysin family protein [Companilactobacillus metriopterae]